MRSVEASGSNVGGPWWAVFIETVSEISSNTEDLFERVGEIDGPSFEEFLTDVRFRR